VVDSSPMYGRAEGVAGDLLEKMDAHGKAFIATKVWTTGEAAGIAEMETSFRLFKTDKIDLMQVHNLVDLDTQMRTMGNWREAGRFRYLGITHYTEGAIPSVIDAMDRHKVDFLQMVYSPVEPKAAERLLPYCQDNGIAFLVNKPLGGRGVISRLIGKPLPEWAEQELGISSWGQFFLKFVIAHPAITCAIPGTSNPSNMADDLKAAEGPLPDSKQQLAMMEYLRTL
ncbi:MAG TPA: aldo/keto reductase, partial [Rhodospirillaceae bacterium]|nr:aldo/keto reductase [Rhodospirillaceae bacterium]